MKNKKSKNVEHIIHNGKKYAEIIWADFKVSKTTFFSPEKSSFQFGLLSHKAGFREPAHFHKPIKRQISDMQQMFVVQRGVVAVELYDDVSLIKEIILHPGDAIVLIHGVHALKVIEDMQCISVKQGPFLGTKEDKILVSTTK